MMIKFLKILFISWVALFVVSTVATADDFDWTRDFNLQAKADPTGFKTRFASRFNLNDFQVIALLSIFDSPADAYIMLRLGEMKGMLKTLSREEGIKAVQKYRDNKEKGWEVLAESLGITPGSTEFKALQHGQDLYPDDTPDKVFYSAAVDSSDVNRVDNNNF